MNFTALIGDNRQSAAFLPDAPPACYGMSGRLTPNCRQTRIQDADGSALWVMGAKMSSVLIRVAARAVVVLLMLSTTASAEGKVPLPQEAHINQQLMLGAAGDVLRNTCPTISARMFVVWGKLNDLESYARAKGYTEAEVKVFLKDKAQKARVKAEAMDYLTKAGVVVGDVETYCTVGRAEIDAGTELGSLLRSSE